MKSILVWSATLGLPVLLTASFKIPVESKVLENGLVVLVVESHEAPLVSVQVWYKVGSRNEHEGITGISHLLEHMMFKGTEKMGPEEYSKIIQSFGGTENAFTAEDETAYWSVLPSSKIEVALELEADRMQNAMFREFEAEKNVVMEERRWRTENSPWSLLYEQVRATAFLAHPYRNPVIGWMGDIEAITLQDIKRHYDNYYTPNNAILVISGDVNHEKAFELAEKYFGKIPKRGEPRRVRSVEPKQQGERQVEVRKEGFVQFYDVAYHIPDFSHEDTPALQILAAILGRGKSSRFYKTLVQDLGLANDIWVWASESIDPTLFFISLSIQQGKSLKDLETAMDSVIEEIKEKGVTQEELEKAKRMLSSSFVFQLQSVAGKGMMVGEYTILGGEGSVNEIIPRLMKVTLEDVRRVARTYLERDNRTIGVLEPIQPADVEAYMKMLEEGSKKTFRR